MDIYAFFLSWIEKYALLEKKDRVVAGISGGADSVALLDLLNRLSQNIKLYIAVASLDHGLRQESREETLWVEEKAKKYGLPFYTQRLELAKEAKTGIEEKARNMRYSFLADVAEKFHANKIAVAHHADDQIETVLLHLFKGTGVHGLSGMKALRPLFPDSSIFLIRPLLGLKKIQILEYLKEKKLTWCEDISNLNTQFTRNRIRHKILPFLEQEGYPKIKENILALSYYAQENSAFIDQQSELFFSQHVKDICPEKPYLHKFFFLLEGKKRAKVICSKAAKTLPSALIPSLFQKIFQSLKVYVSLRSSHYQRIAQLLQEQSGIAELPEDIQIFKTPAYLSIVLPSKSCFSQAQFWYPPGKIACGPYAFLEAQKKESQNFDLNSHRNLSNPLSVAIDADNFFLPFVLRPCCTEDTIKLLGAPGIKKMARIFSDLKIPFPMRSKMILLTDSKNSPLWLPGIGIAHCARIKKETKKIWELSIKSS